MREKMKICAIEGCLNKYSAKGLCRKHYLKEYHHEWHKKNYMPSGNPVGPNLIPKKGLLNGRWKGGTYKVNGYIKYSAGEHKERLIHDVIAEKAIGRRLKKGEVVHHINGIKDDNRNCNLLICDSSFHKWLHHQILLKGGSTHAIPQSRA